MKPDPSAKNPDPDEVVKVYAGPYVAAEAYQLALTDAGIESRMVGDALLASYGSAIPNSIEIWVHRKDAEKALAVIKQEEEQKGKGEHETHRHPHPKSDAKPGAAPPRKEPHVKQDPSGE
jgi:hypothetical protein